MKIAFSSLILVVVAAFIFSISSATTSRMIRIGDDARHAGISHSVIHKTAMKADTNIDWDKMSKADKKQYMKDIIMPKMKPLFQAFDAKHFADFKCVTCHGNGARTGEFKMPNPQLPKLPSSPAGWEKLSKDKPAMMKFMSKTVKPTMTDLLGMKPFDMKTGAGFGCGNCHTSEKN
jgi:hypothetical protein